MKDEEALKSMKTPIACSQEPAPSPSLAADGACPACDGAGETTVAWGLAICPHCNGSGRVATEPPAADGDALPEDAKLHFVELCIEENKRLAAANAALTEKLAKQDAAVRAAGMENLASDWEGFESETEREYLLSRLAALEAEKQERMDHTAAMWDEFQAEKASAQPGSDISLAELKNRTIAALEKERDALREALKPFSLDHIHDGPTDRAWRARARAALGGGQ